MKITSILLKESIDPNLISTDKISVIQELARLIQKNHPNINLEKLTEILLGREKLGSTGIGSGVAIPHGKISDLENIIAAFGRSKTGIDFESQDGEPTHLFFVLVAPENSAGLHLKALAKLSRLLKNSSFRNKLLESQDAESLYQAIAEEDEKS